MIKVTFNDPNFADASIYVFRVELQRAGDPPIVTYNELPKSSIHALPFYSVATKQVHQVYEADLDVDTLEGDDIFVQIGSVRENEPLVRNFSTNFTQVSNPLPTPNILALQDLA